jgi:hypothetical protein
MRLVIGYLITALILLSGLLSLLFTLWAFRRGAIVLGILFLVCTTVAFHWLWRAWRVLIKRPH